MPRKTFLTLTSFILFSLLVLPVFAESDGTSTDAAGSDAATDTTTDSNTGKSFSDKYQQRKTDFEARKADFEQAKSDRQQQLQDRKAEMEAKKDEMVANRDAKQAERCENVSDRVDAKIAKFEENKDGHVNRYNNLQDKLAEIVSKLKDKDFDTSKLEDDIDTLDGMVREYADLYTDFIDYLVDSKGLVCGESDGAYKDILANARAKLQEARAKRSAIREFYRTVIRQDIQDLRSQAADLRSGDSE